MFQSYTIKMLLCLLLIGKCDSNASLLNKVVRSLDIFMNRFVRLVQQEIHARLNVSMYHFQLPSHLDSMTGRRIDLGEDRTARIFGLSFKFVRNGNCGIWIQYGKSTICCPVKFDDLQVQLPQYNNKETVYVAHATVKGALVFHQGRNGTAFQRFILLQQRYEMMNSDGEPVNPPPAAYCLKVKSAFGLKGILRTFFQYLIVDGEFKEALVSSLKKVRKAQDISGS
uniref:Putative secreted protein n=1 Tax=Ixodes ricinus TaxID=34613 RepID=A0A6B0V4E3_IXORI